ncbi:MAG: hypothetical protein K2I19_08910, partial [Muribaculaceae bacterium]|nr:hypothetical protein [Muribaculaceae bacterium]
LLHHKTKITQRYATPALTNIGEPALIHTASAGGFFMNFSTDRNYADNKHFAKTARSKAGKHEKKTRLFFCHFNNYYISLQH